MGRKATELNNEIRLAVSKAFPGVVTLWPAHVLVAWVCDERGEHPIQAGKTGGGDLSGIAVIDHGGRKFGVRLEIETKTKNDRNRETQIRFRRTVEQYHGIYIVGRVPEHVIAMLEKHLGIPRKA